MSRCQLVLIFFLFAVASRAGELPPLKYAELGDFELVSGKVIRDAKLGYRTLGRLDPDRSNVVLFPTWFTGTTEELFQRGVTELVDTSRFYLVTVEAWGNGVSSSPSNSERQPGTEFPDFTIRDMVNAQRRLLTEVLGVSKLHAVMGISMGGMQSFEWITAYPEFVDRAVPIVGSPRLGPYDLLLWSTQLEAIEQTRTCGCNEARTMELIGMVFQLALQTPGFFARQTSYDGVGELIRQARESTAGNDIDDRAAQLRAMIAHDVSGNFGGSMEKAASVVKAKVLNVVGIQDHVVTPEPALRFADFLSAESLELNNDCGHRAYSCEFDRVREAVRAFLAN